MWTSRIVCLKFLKCEIHISTNCVSVALYALVWVGKQKNKRESDQMKRLKRACLRCRASCKCLRPIKKSMPSEAQIYLSAPQQAAAAVFTIVTARKNSRHIFAVTCDERKMTPENVRRTNKISAVFIAYFRPTYLSFHDQCERGHLRFCASPFFVRERESTRQLFCPLQSDGLTWINFASV